MLELLYQPWPWYIAGPMIALVMLALLLFGQNFGVSSNLRTICTMVGGSYFSDFFKIDWKSYIWNLVFIVGAIIGGYIAVNYLSYTQEVILNPATVKNLQSLGFTNPGSSYLPEEIFGVSQIFTLKGLAILIGGGFLIGFGARYAGGCTSGHAISGISNLQLPSLIAVVGFFIGGLIMTHFVLPLIF